LNALFFTPGLTLTPHTFLCLSLPYYIYNNFKCAKNTQKVLSSGWFKEDPASSRLDEATISIAKRAADSAKRTAEKAKLMNAAAAPFNHGGMVPGFAPPVMGMMGGVLGVPHSMNAAMQAAANAAHRLRLQGIMPSTNPGGLYGGGGLPPPSSSQPPSYMGFMSNQMGVPPMPPALALALAARGPPMQAAPALTQEQIQAKELAMAQARAQAKLIAQQHSKN
jgi:hypothetical protein